MALEDAHRKAMDDLDAAFREDDSAPFAMAAIADDWNNNYSPWYSRLLSSLTLLTAGQPLIFAQGTKAYDDSRARALVFTESLVILADISDVNESRPPQPIALGRQSIRSLKVTTSMRIDMQGSSALGWPGKIHFSLSYAGIDEAIEFEAPGTDYSGKPAAGQLLLNGLRVDLANASDNAKPVQQN